MENNENSVIEKQLVVIVEENNLPQSEGQIIVNSFLGFFKLAKSFEEVSRTLVVNDVSQVEEMEKAKDIRKKLSRCRLDAEQARKEFKSGYLSKGKAVDAIAKLVSNTIEPLEEYFENQEKFAERIEKQKIQDMITARENALKQYIEDISIYNVVVMSDDAFNTLLADLKATYDKKVEAELKAREEQIAKEKAEKEEAEKNRLENIRLKADAELKEKELEAERAKAQAEKDEQEKALALERAENEKKLQAERDEKAKIEKELADKKAKEDEEEKEKIEKERLAQLAPEKEKLTLYAESIRTIQAPNDLSKAGLEIVKMSEQKLLALSQEIKLAIKNL